MQQQYSNFLWWESGIIYQVYPRSFQDSNDDGVGDLRGLISRLDYLQWLGVHAVWVSPIYPSPMKDFGYDVADYTGIHPMFGSLADFDELVVELHTRGMKVILDFVPNHSSDEHPWFIQSRSSRDNPKRDWYLWKDRADDGGPPNNWLSVFGGSAWEWDERTGQYYYHAFLKEQPDLNWRNPEVQGAMLDSMRFWLDRGVDGFRVDVMWHMIKDEFFRDNPPNPNYRVQQSSYGQVYPVFSTDQPAVHGIVRMMRSLLNEYSDRMMIGEIYLPIQQLVTYYGEDRSGAHLPFNFMLVTLPWDPLQISQAIAEYEKAIPDGGWPNWVLGNHDQPRIASRVGPEQARVAAVMLLTLRGTPTLYYGDELGMKDVPVPIDQMQDPQGLNMPDKNLSRDPARTPMQWDSTRNSGFTSGTPWLPMSSTRTQVNVDVQRNDPLSMLSLYRRLIRLRNAEPSLSVGEYHLVYADGQILSFSRSAPGSDAFLIILNLSHRPAFLKQEDLSYSGTVEISTELSSQGKRVSGMISLSGDEAMVIRLISPRPPKRLA